MSRSRAAIIGALGVVALTLSGCVSSVGVNYGYNDAFYWNHYYYGSGGDIIIDPPDRPDRPDRPPVNRPERPPQPPTTLPGRPPTAKPLPARPPIHTPSRPRGGGRLR